MPIYTYECTECGDEINLTRSVDARDTETICCHCIKPMKRIPNFKGDVRVEGGTPKFYK